MNRICFQLAFPVMSTLLFKKIYHGFRTPSYSHIKERHWTPTSHDIKNEFQMDHRPKINNKL